MTFTFINHIQFKKIITQQMNASVIKYQCIGCFPICADMQSEISNWLAHVLASRCECTNVQLMVNMLDRDGYEPETIIFRLNQYKWCISCQYSHPITNPAWHVYVSAFSCYGGIWSKNINCICRHMIFRLKGHSNMYELNIAETQWIGLCAYCDGRKKSAD